MGEDGGDWLGQGVRTGDLGDLEGDLGDLEGDLEGDLFTDLLDTLEEKDLLLGSKVFSALRGPDLNFCEPCLSNCGD